MGACFLATSGPAACNPSVWRATLNVAPAPGVISPILEERPSPASPCAVAIPFRFMNAPGLSTSAFSAFA